MSAEEGVSAREQSATAAGIGVVDKSNVAVTTADNVRVCGCMRRFGLIGLSQKRASSQPRNEATYKNKLFTPEIVRFTAERVHTEGFQPEFRGHFPRRHLR